MFVMDHLLNFVLMFVVFSVMSLGVAFVPYQGVIALMGASFFCCMLMILMGRTFIALVVYIVYLGGLIVVFGYCVSLEKDKEGVVKIRGYKYAITFVVSSLVHLCGSFSGLLTYPGWEGLLCLEVNACGVFYYGGAMGLVVCSWGLLVVLFSVLVILSWSRLGGFRPF